MKGDGKGYGRKLPDEIAVGCRKRREELVSATDAVHVGVSTTASLSRATRHCRHTDPRSLQSSAQTGWSLLIRSRIPIASDPASRILPCTPGTPPASSLLQTGLATGRRLLRSGPTWRRGRLRIRPRTSSRRGRRSCRPRTAARWAWCRTRAQTPVRWTRSRSLHGEQGEKSERRHARSAKAELHGQARALTGEDGR